MAERDLRDYLLYLPSVKKKLTQELKGWRPDTGLVSVAAGRGFLSCLLQSHSAGEGSRITCFRKYPSNTGLFVSSSLKFLEFHILSIDMC